MEITRTDNAFRQGVRFDIDNGWSVSVIYDATDKGSRIYADRHTYEVYLRDANGNGVGGDGTGIYAWQTEAEVKQLIAETSCRTNRAVKNSFKI